MTDFANRQGVSKASRIEMTFCRISTVHGDIIIKYYLLYIFESSSSLPLYGVASSSDEI